jgi:putative FmdB family regulatory protein
VPLYEYRCKKCDQQFELMRGLAARDKLAVCPACRSRSTVRLKFQAFAVLGGARPDAAMGEGEAEDFMGGGDDHDHGHGHDHGFDDLDMGDDFDF